jgi:hypothetical protein
MDRAVVLVVQQRRDHVANRQDVIDETTGCGVLRHAALSMMVEFRLAEGQAAMLLDRRDPPDSIAAEARQDGADGKVALVPGDLRRHRRVTGNNVTQRAGMVRVEVLDQYERHAAVGRHCFEEGSKRVEAACGCTDTDDQAHRPGVG